MIQSHVANPRTLSRPKSTPQRSVCCVKRCPGSSIKTSGKLLLCPWHYASLHTIWKLYTDFGNIKFFNANLEASLLSMNDAKDDGNIESLLNALPPSPKPQSSRSICFLLLRTIRRKSTKHHPPGSNSKLCKLCVFESIVFESKNRQQVFKHMFSRHKVLNHFQDGIDKMRAERKQPSGSAANLPSISFAAIVSSSSSPLFVAVSASLTPSVSALPTPSFHLLILLL